MDRFQEIANCIWSIDKLGRGSVPPDLILTGGDLLFDNTNSIELVGKVSIFRATRDDRVTIASYLVRLRTNAMTDPEFLNYPSNSALCQALISSMALLSVNQANVNRAKLGAMKVALPPRQEQEKIATIICEKTSRIDTAIAEIRWQIAKLQEYRTALISAAATGKIDVTEAAEA